MVVDTATKPLFYYKKHYILSIINVVQNGYVF